MSREFTAATHADSSETPLMLEAGVVGVVLAGVVATIFLGGGIPRVVASLLAVFVFPGYALTTVLFPEHGDRVPPRTNSAVAEHRSLSYMERAGISIGASIVVVILSVLLLGGVGLGYSQSIVTTGLTAVSVILFAGGVIRRAVIEPEVRFVLPLVESARFFGGDSPQEVVVNVALALGIIAATGALVYGVAAPQPGPNYTEATLKTENADGEFAAVNPETTLEAGESVDMKLEVTNRLGTETTYTVVVELHRFGADDTVLLSTPVETYQSTLEDGETWEQPHSIETKTLGDELRVTYLIYQGEPPENPTTANSHRYLTFWISVTQ